MTTPNTQHKKYLVETYFHSFPKKSNATIFQVDNNLNVLRIWEHCSCDDDIFSDGALVD